MEAGFRLARAYVPFQELGMVWSPEEGLKMGTIFPELCFPYQPTRGRR